MNKEIIAQILKLSEQSFRRGFAHGARFQKDFGVSEDQINVWRNETPLSVEVVLPVGSETQFVEKSLYKRVKTEISFKEEFAELTRFLESEDPALNQDEKKLTLGEYRVGKNFNPSKDKLVDEIKTSAAGLIDLIEQTKLGGVAIHDDFAPIAVEKNRLANIAQDQVESAAMFAVKAATKNQ